jgi:hypothetical protein
MVGVIHELLLPLSVKNPLIKIKFIISIKTKTMLCYNLPNIPRNLISGCKKAQVNIRLMGDKLSFSNGRKTNDVSPSS